jgi:hypothetical protein
MDSKQPTQAITNQPVYLISRASKTIEKVNLMVKYGYSLKQDLRYVNRNSADDAIVMMES